MNKNRIAKTKIPQLRIISDKMTENEKKFENLKINIKMNSTVIILGQFKDNWIFIRHGNDVGIYQENNLNKNIKEKILTFENCKYVNKKNLKVKLGQCIICKTVFNTYEKLTYHFKYYLLGECINNFKCDTCKTSYKSKNGLNNHNCIIKQNYNNNKCKICNKYYSNNETYNRHIFKHKNNIPKCKRCQKECEHCKKIKDKLRKENKKYKATPSKQPSIETVHQIEHPAKQLVVDVLDSGTTACEGMIYL